MLPVPEQIVLDGSLSFSRRNKDEQNITHKLFEKCGLNCLDLKENNPFPVFPAGNLACSSFLVLKSLHFASCTQSLHSTVMAVLLSWLLGRGQSATQCPCWHIPLLQCYMQPLTLNSVGETQKWCSQFWLVGNSHLGILTSFVASAAELHLVCPSRCCQHGHGELSKRAEREHGYTQDSTV